MDKRGFELSSFLRIILAIIVVVFLYTVLVTLMPGGGSGDIEEVTARSNFYSLADAVSKLKVDDTKFYDANNAYILNVPRGHILVGYNKESDRAYDACQPESSTKPVLCRDNACLCWWRKTGEHWYTPIGDDNDFDDDANGGNLVDCRALNEVDYVFTLDYNDDKIKNEPQVKDKVYQNILGQRTSVQKNKYYQDEYVDLFIYGRCQDYYTDVDLGIQNVYIEKLKYLGKTYLFIAVKSSRLDQRNIDLVKEVKEAMAKAGQNIVQTGQAGQEKKTKEEGKLFSG